MNDPKKDTNERLDVTKVVLDSAGEMQGHLLRIPVGEHAEERFFPLLLQHAGTEKTGEEIAKILLDAIDEYARRLPAGRTQQIEKDFLQTQEKVLAFLLALIRDDENVMQEAWSTVLARLAAS